MEFHESLNDPPRLFAVDRSGGNQYLALDPNPHLLADFQLGHVRALDGQLSTGERWSALLYLPVHYDSGKRYPVVFQFGGIGLTAGGDPESGRFSLYGPNGPAFAGLGPSEFATYAAQELAGRGIAVVDFVANAKTGTPSEGETYRACFEYLLRRLNSEGLVDQSRVGVIGFSRNGYFVGYTITHSTAPIAAVSIADSFDGSYLQAVASGNYVEFAAVNGALPIGEGLRNWLKSAPGFNVEHVQAPVRFVAQSGSTIQSALEFWEMYSQLQYLNRPAEIYIMPEIDRYGSHSPQNPTQVLALQESTTDWFDFWLNGHESKDADKKKQYERWRKLRQINSSNRGSSELLEPKRPYAATR